MARKGIAIFTRAAGRELASLDLAMFSASMVRASIRAGIYFSVENPLSSKPWSWEMSSALRRLPGVFDVVWDCCRYDADYKKPTRLLTNMPSLATLGRRCCGGHSHVKLGGGRTLKAAAYTPSLCAQWAQAASESCPSEAAPPDCSSATEVLDDLLSNAMEARRARNFLRAGHARTTDGGVDISESVTRYLEKTVVHVRGARTITAKTIEETRGS